MLDNIIIPLFSGTKRPKPQTPFADIVCLTLHIKGQRVRPTISPLANRPLTPEEIRFAVKLADYAARVLP